MLGEDDILKKYIIITLLIILTFPLLPQNADNDSKKFITVKKVDNRWYLISPDGQPFISKGVNHINYKGDLDYVTQENIYTDTLDKKYESKEAWAEATYKRMKKFGLNTIGAWSSLNELKRDDIYFIGMVYLARTDWDTGGIDDYFSKEFEEHANKTFLKTLSRYNYKEEKNLIGYCIDNELRWGIDWRSYKSIVFDYLNFDEEAAGKKAVIDFLKVYYDNDIRQLNHDWFKSFKSWDQAYKDTNYTINTHSGKKAESELLYFIADVYYKKAREIILKHDPNHMIIGNRFIGAVTPKEVLRAAGKYLDIITVNYYKLIMGLENGIPDLLGYTSTDNYLEEFFKITDKPLLITETGFRGVAKNAPSTRPFIYPRYFSQKKRGQVTYDFLFELLSKNYIVGYHLFQWFDQPINGRNHPDRENNNWGFVDIYDNEYENYTYYIKKLNAHDF